MQRSKSTVVVVGAGMAGLSTAYHLLQAGFSKVTILEASNRVGGRIMSVRPKDGGGVVEMGAAYIHGASLENPIYKLASDWGMADSLTPIDRISGQYYQENGEKVDRAIVEQVWQHYLGMEKSMEQIFTARDKTQPFTNSTTMAQYARQARQDLLQHFPEGERREAADKVFNTMLTYCQFTNGDDLNLVSADLCGQYITIPGPDMMFSGNGYGGFVEELQKKIPKEVIHFHTEVATIHWGSSTVEITCKNGKKYNADHVVLTCSLGHLKANYKQMFEPQLPESKTGAIERIGFGRVAKVFLYYDQPFWTDDTNLVWSRHDQPTTETSEWVKGLVAFESFPTNPKAIGHTFAGRCAEIMEQVSDEEVSKTCTDLLRMFHKDPTIPEPTMVLKSSWNSNPLFRGTYSYLSDKSRENDIHDLAAPLPNDCQPTLLFAGEATHPDFYSTVHGAYLSGVRESQRLANLYKQ